MNVGGSGSKVGDGSAGLVYGLWLIALARKTQLSIDS